MTTKSRNKDEAPEAPVERDFEEAKMPEAVVEAAEDRQPDQIPDYHQKNPTLKNDAETPPGDQE